MTSSSSCRYGDKRSRPLPAIAIRRACQRGLHRRGVASPARGVDAPANEYGFRDPLDSVLLLDRTPPVKLRLHRRAGVRDVELLNNFSDGERCMPDRSSVEACRTSVAYALLSRWDLPFSLRTSDPPPWFRFGRLPLDFIV